MSLPTRLHFARQCIQHVLDHDIDKTLESRRAVHAVRCTMLQAPTQIGRYSNASNLVLAMWIRHKRVRSSIGIFQQEDRSAGVEVGENIAQYCFSQSKTLQSTTGHPSNSVGQTFRYKHTKAQTFAQTCTRAVQTVLRKLSLLV